MKTAYIFEEHTSHEYAGVELPESFWTRPVEVLAIDIDLRKEQRVTSIVARNNAQRNSAAYISEEPSIWQVCELVLFSEDPPASQELSKRFGHLQQ